MHATIPKGNMGYDQYTVPDDCSCRTYFCCFPLALANTFPWPFVPILSNFFEKKETQNHPQCLSGLSRALFPTTFLEIAVYKYLKSLPDTSSQIFHWKKFARPLFLSLWGIILSRQTNKTNKSTASLLRAERWAVTEIRFQLNSVATYFSTCLQMSFYKV